MTDSRIDPEFTALPLRDLADAALAQAKALGAQHADFRAERLRGHGAQRRCSCPIHKGDGRSRTFSVNLHEDRFQCFDRRCGKKGDVLDLWAALHHLELRDAAIDLVRTFGLEAAPSRATEKRNG